MPSIFVVGKFRLYQSYLENFHLFTGLLYSPAFSAISMPIFSPGRLSAVFLLFFSIYGLSALLILFFIF